MAEAMKTLKNLNVPRAIRMSGLFLTCWKLEGMSPEKIYWLFCVNKEIPAKFFNMTP